MCFLLFIGLFAGLILFIFGCSFMFGKSNDSISETVDKSIKSTGKKMIVIGSITIILVAGYYYGYHTSESQNAKRETDRIESKCGDNGDVEAYVMSQEFVRERLKSPSEANFPKITSISVTRVNHCEFQVLGYVDGVNDFGAKLRKSYKTLMVYQPEKDSWQANNLVIE